MAKKKKKADKKKAAAPEQIDVAVAEVVDLMRINGDFAPALAEVVERKIAVAAAKKAGLGVSTAELQKAADGFRALRDLTKARDTQRWLKANGITIEALEDYLETNILLSKFKDKLAKSAPKKLMASNAVKDTVRRLAYQSWLTTAMK